MVSHREYVPVKGYPFEVLIPARLKVSGAVLSDQLKGLDWRARRAELICRIPESTISEVQKRVGVLLR